MSRLTKHDLLSEIRIGSTIQDLAEAIGMEWEDVVEVANMSGKASQGEHSVEEAGFYGFLTGLECGFHLGVKEGERVVRGSS